MLASELTNVKPGATLALTLESGEVEIKTLYSGPADPATGYEIELIGVTPSGRYLTILARGTDDLFVSMRDKQ